MQKELERQLAELLQEESSEAIERERSTFDSLAGPQRQNLVLFGAGGQGSRTLAGLRSLGIEPLAFADNNPAVWGKSVGGLEVLAPAEAVRQFASEAVFVVTIWGDLGGHPAAQIRDQLASYGEARVVSVGFLFWKYPQALLPFFFCDLPHKTLEQRQQVLEAMQLWADEDSRGEYLAQVRLRLWLDIENLPPRVAWPSYFPDQLFALSSEEVFVDCGAFTGDTLRDYLQKQNTPFRQYVAFEPDPVNYQQLQDYCDSLPTLIRQRILVSNSAVGDRNGQIRFAATGTAESVASTTGGVTVPVSCLDSVLRETPATYIKMDIEGAEGEALIGCSGIIRAHRPVLAICVYHHFDHLWRLPLLIQSLADQYRFYLRPHRAAGWDLVCYAVPVERVQLPFCS
jgi:FkbM family methyltransferase